MPWVCGCAVGYGRERVRERDGARGRGVQSVFTMIRARESRHKFQSSRTNRDLTENKQKQVRPHSNPTETEDNRDLTSSSGDLNESNERPPTALMLLCATIVVLFYGIFQTTSLPWETGKALQAACMAACPPCTSDSRALDFATR